MYVALYESAHWAQEVNALQFASSSFVVAQSIWSSHAWLVGDAQGDYDIALASHTRFLQGKKSEKTYCLRAAVSHENVDRKKSFNDFKEIVTMDSKKEIEILEKRERKR